MIGKTWFSNGHHRVKAWPLFLSHKRPYYGGTPNLHFPHLHRTQIYTSPKFTRDPNLHKPRFTQDPYFHSPDLHKSISAHKFKKKKLTQPKFAQNPNLHKTFSSNFAQNIYQVNSISTLISSKKTMPALVHFMVLGPFWMQWEPSSFWEPSRY